MSRAGSLRGCVAHLLACEVKEYENRPIKDGKLVLDQKVIEARDDAIVWNRRLMSGVAIDERHGQPGLTQSRVESNSHIDVIAFDVEPANIVRLKTVGNQIKVMVS